LTSALALEAKMLIASIESAAAPCASRRGRRRDEPVSFESMMIAPVSVGRAWLAATLLLRAGIGSGARMGSAV